MDTAKEILRLSKTRPWYQWVEIDGQHTKRKEHEKSKRRTVPFMKWVQKYVQPDHRVLDVGCCSGLYSLLAGEVCQEVCGVDVDRAFIKQARWLKAKWEEKLERRLDNVSFHTLDIVKRLNLIKRFNFLIVAKVLYHPGFKAGIHSFMRNVKRSPIKTILAQGHTTRGRYGIRQGMAMLFEQYGFKSEFVEDVREYPIVRAWRE